MLELSTKFFDKFVTEGEIYNYQSKVTQCHNFLHEESFQSPKFNGWIDFCSKIKMDEIRKIKKAAENIISNSDVFIVIGIGGSYLGAAAAIDFLNSQNYNYLSKSTPNIFFVGNNVSSDYLQEIMNICKNKDVSINVISKSGSTIEPAISFRIFKKFLEEKYGVENSRKRIYCTTDGVHGALLQMATEEGYEIFDIPGDIGGRYSVLTAVGLLPIAVSGADISKIIDGAVEAQKIYANSLLKGNDCYRYAVMRNVLYHKGKLIEILAGYEPKLSMFFEWWKQLFGESEGKDGKGIFPSSVIYSRDLHSLGQYVQQGNKILFETVLNFKNSKGFLCVPHDKKNLDALNYLTGRSLSDINSKICEATVEAHAEGNVPNILISVDDFSEYNFGFLVYFFEKACAMSALLMGVDPFNQPGVEAYKNKMFSLLGKPGCNKNS